MVTGPRRGDVWWAEMDDKRRPVLVMTRSAAIPLLHRVVVVPITRRVRLIPTEVALGGGDGMPEACAATFDNITTADTSKLLERITHLSEERMREVCRAMNVAVGC